MTTVRFYRSQAGLLLGYEAGGHAVNPGRITSEKTLDLVCSAVSALTQTGVNALISVAGLSPRTEVKDGWLRCMLPADTAASSPEGQIILDTIRVGLTGIAEAYPRFVKIDEVTNE